MKIEIILSGLLFCTTVLLAQPHFKEPFKMPGIENVGYPVAEFVDWDGDGDDDVLLGQMGNSGAVSLYTNSAGAGKTPVLKFTRHLKADGKQISLPSP